MFYFTFFASVMLQRSMTSWGSKLKVYSNEKERERERAQLYIVANDSHDVMIT